MASTTRTISTKDGTAELADAIARRSSHPLTPDWLARTARTRRRLP
ncbi:hypothetical protein [Streptomyces sp. NPDC002054]